jgi:O-acetylhomoserine/O-acetylserine sulfhydrylase-like pyridoxal-dependent enzyme
MNNRLEFYKKEAEDQAKIKTKDLESIKQKRFDTIATHGIYSLSEAMSNNGSIIEPVYMSTAQVFRDSDEMAAALAYDIPSWSYTRINNPSVHYLESTLALLEGYQCDVDTSCCVSASGMSAIATVVDALLVDSIDANYVSSSQLYGGSFQQFSVRQKQKLRNVRWVYPSETVEKWAEQIDENTRFIYVETPSNPSLALCNIPELSALAHKHGIPLVVDSTLATPALLRPISFGADIVIHSLSKTITASGLSIGGAIISKANISADYLPTEAKADFAMYLKLFPNRDNGACLSPLQAFITLSELRTIRTRIDKLSQNTEQVVNFLENHPKIELVLYPGSSTHRQHQLAKYLFKLVDSQDINRYGHLVSFTVAGGLNETKMVLDKMNLIFRATDLGRIKSVATIPAISTHQQQGSEGRDLAGIPDNLIRLCVGGEHPQDIIDDIDQALTVLN